MGRWYLHSDSTDRWTVWDNGVPVLMYADDEDIRDLLAGTEEDAQSDVTFSESDLDVETLTWEEAIEYMSEVEVR